MPARLPRRLCRRWGPAADRTDAITPATPDILLVQETSSAWERALVGRYGGRMPIAADFARQPDAARRVLGAMRTLMLVGLGLGLGLGACGDSRVFAPLTPPAPPAATQLRVMSYNMNFGIAGDADSIDAIAAAAPDLAFLQETNDAWEHAIVERIGARYPHRKFDPPTSWVAGGMGVLSRYPIVKLDTLVAPKAPFFAWRAVIDTPLGRIQVFNLHLRPPMSDGGSWVVGYFSTRDDRLREIQYHLEALDPKLPALFVGDFNEERDGRAVSLLEDRGFVDAIGEFAGARRTWEWQLKGGMTLSFQLDHIMHDAHFVPVTARIVEAGHSDHKPVYADFERIDP